MIEICFIEGSAEVEFAFDREGGKNAETLIHPKPSYSGKPRFRHQALAVTDSHSATITNRPL